MLEMRFRHARSHAAMSRLSTRTALLMTLPPLLWAGNAIVGRLMVGSVPPLMLSFLRWAIAGLFLLPLGWRVLARPRAIAARWPHLLLLGLLGVSTYNAMQYLALVTTTPINVTLIAASSPVWMLAVGAAFHGAPVRAPQFVGAALSIAGVLLVIARGDPAALARIELVTGDLYVLVAIIAWTFYSWMLARPVVSMRPPQRPSWNWAEFLLVQVLFGLVPAGVAAGAEQLQGAAPIAWSGTVIAALIYIAIGPSIIAYRCWGLGIAAGGPSLVAFFANLTPVFAALMSAVVLGEAPRWYHGLAFALIVAGIFVSSLRGGS
jgi:drug/metabolite transporter (DMT)-like permease